MSGTLSVLITAACPLLIRGFGTDAEPAAPTRPGSGGREHILPGSALHGAVRSLHETLTGSCLRAVDEDYVPSYRQGAIAGEIRRLRLAVVAQVDPANPHGSPRVRLCEAGDPVRHRLNQSVLEHIHATHGLRSGDRLRVALDPGGNAVDASPAADGDWVVFISDGAARDEKQPYRAHVRQLTNADIRLPDGVWSDFLKVVEEADDLRTARLAQVPESERYVPVTYRYAPVGRPARDIVVGERSLARRTVHVGQPLWLLMSETGEVGQVRLSMIWRQSGAGAVGDRIPPGFHACWDPERLCPSCRLFGSADTRGVDTARAHQRSYRGHVRFGDAVAVKAETVSVRLPPMGRPHPGAGQFYLNSTAVAGDAGNPPLRQWGSAADRGESRRLRGRKFYWHTSVPNGHLPRRGKARPHHADNVMAVDAVAFAIGSTFTARIVFSDLDRTQLGGLIAALRPDLALGEGSAFVHIGGGKPLGYGSCTMALDPAGSAFGPAADRYRGMKPTQFDEATQRDLVAEFVTAHRDRHVWPQLAKVLQRDAVDPDLVWYPPGPGQPGAKSFDEGYEFWKQTAGAEMAPDNGTRRGYPLTPLPDLGDTDQRLPIVPKAQIRNLPPRRGR
ncbi:TIGR03986 family type III CRISPR-associated RAMP protein [Actinophytocola sp. KF-1]